MLSIRGLLWRLRFRAVHSSVRSVEGSAASALTWRWLRKKHRAGPLPDQRSNRGPRCFPPGRKG